MDGSLNLYKNLQVLRAKTPEDLAEMIRGIKGQLIRVEQFLFDGTDHIAYVVSQRGLTIIRKSKDGN